MIIEKPHGYNYFNRQVFSNFGRWVYTTSLGTILNFIEYDTKKINNKKIITRPMTLNNDIIGVSSASDCVLTFVPAS